MNLHAVKQGFYLHWPEDFGPTTARLRGGPGYVVDLDAPFETKWCKGQMHKLIPAEKGAKPSAIEHPRATRELSAKRRADEKPVPNKPAVGGGMPAVDMPLKPAPKQKV